MNKIIKKFGTEITFELKENGLLWVSYEQHWFKPCCEFKIIQIETMIHVCLTKQQLDCLMKMICNVC